MHVSTFLKHWGLRENPFMAEEARQDDVFARLQGVSSHPDFPKVLGDLARPSSAVVFGEKGSGKTAIRLQMEEKIHEFNQANPDRKVLVIAYDELNPVLDRFARKVKGKTPLETLRQLRLVDHIDGLLSVATPDLVGSLIGQRSQGHVDVGPDARRVARQLDAMTRQDLVILQALYDRPDQAVERGPLLRRAVRFRAVPWMRYLRRLAVALWVALVAGVIAYAVFATDEQRWVWWVGLGALAIVTILATGKAAMDWWWLRGVSQRLSNQLRVLDRSAESFRAGLDRLPRSLLKAASLPIDDLDDHRYAMLDRLRRATRPFGFENMIVLLDRVDEPTLVNGEVERMKAVIWPMLNNKFLQMNGTAFKMLLPLELRREVYRMPSEFFQEARLDKQNMIDRLTWPGATLYDVCNARLAACAENGATAPSLKQLFDDSVSRPDLVDALDQMRQPRDAFKMLYQAIHLHCSNVPEEEPEWHIPKLVLDQVRRGHAERIEELHRGQRPA